MKHTKVIFLTQAAVIAALYVVLTLLANVLGLANYSIQIRFSEALILLPVFTPAAIPGLYVGCLLSNVLTGCIIWDVICGPLATLLGAFGTYLLRKKHPVTAALPPILSNILIVPFVLAYAYQFEGSVFYFMITVGLGEILSCGVLGYFLWKVLKKYAKFIFPAIPA